MAQYTQRTQPMHRHSKWFEYTFGDTEIGSTCQIVCEAHMDPAFVRILRRRHIYEDIDADKENNALGIESSGPSSVNGRPRKRKARSRKTTKKPTTKQSKDRAKTKKKTKPEQYDPLPEPDHCNEEMLEQTMAEKETLVETALNEPPEKRARLETKTNDKENNALGIKSSGPSSVNGPPKKRKARSRTKLTCRKTTKKPTTKQSKDRAKTKKKTKPEQYDPLPEPDHCNEEMLEQTMAEKETLVETALNEPPEKRARLETPPLQYVDNDNDSITYEIIIKDDPDNFEGEILPSVICDDVDVEVKREYLDNTEVMDYEPEHDYQPVVDVKIEATDNVLEKHIDNILFEYEIVPPSFKVVEETSQTTDLPAPKPFETFSELLNSVVKQNLISSGQRDILAQFKVESHLFMDYTQLLNPKAKMKSFAIALYVMSHKAYDYILRTYKTSLPPLTTVKDWLVQRKGHSGFTRETLEAINFMSKDSEEGEIKKSPIYICLVLKKIKLHNYYRAPSKRISSVVGNTTNPLEWSLATANSVLVLTAAAINASWKLPIGYFWNNVVKDSEQANLVKVAIDILETVGAVPVAISFESNDDNRRMCEELSGSHTPTVKEYFMSSSGMPIFVFPDPCDILELIDKDIEDIECYDESHRLVSLKHLPEFLKYADIPSEPITLKKVIASQLSRKDFRSYKGPGAGTLTFLEHLQNVFEILFLRHSAQVQKLMEAGPMDKRPEDIHRHAVMLHEAGMYMKSLKIKDSTESLVALDHFSSLMSFYTLIRTTLMMICKYWSIPFGKFIGNSSYFLSNLMPQCSGNRNPTANTFQREYKAMLPLLHCSTERNIHNFLMLKCKNPVETINLTTAIPNGNKLKMFAHDFWKLLRCETDEFTDEFVVYVSRYVTTILIYELHCETCICAIRSRKANISENEMTRPEPEKVKKKLVVTKLHEPSSDVMDICKKSEQVFKTAVLYRNWSINVKLCVPLLVSKVLKKYVNRPLFEDLLHHQFDTDRTCNHLIELTRAVASSYLNLRISHWKRNVRSTKVKTY